MIRNILAFPFNVISIILIGLAYPFVLITHIIGKCWIKEWADKLDEEIIEYERGSGDEV